MNTTIGVHSYLQAACVIQVSVNACSLSVCVNLVEGGKVGCVAVTAMQ